MINLKKEGLYSKKTENKRINGGVYMEKKNLKIGKVILLSILILLAVFLVFTIRKFVILTSLQKKIVPYETSQNVYKKSVTNRKESLIETFESYYKDGVVKAVVTMKPENNITKKIIQFTSPNETKSYIQNGEEKVMSSYSNGPTSQNIVGNFVGADTIFHTIFNSIVSKITSEKIGEKEYYAVEGLYNTNFLYGQDTKNVKVYLDKETGLAIKMIEFVEEEGEKKEYITTYEYKFDTITDKDMEEPDASEYTVKNNN